MIGVDWGSSSFRLMRLAEDGEILSEIHQDMGVSRLGTASPEAYLLNQIEADLRSLPVVMCGMIGSGIGWQEVPYIECPTDSRGLAGELTRIASDKLEVYIVPGVKTLSALDQPDVMRGEETQIVGWLNSVSDPERARSLLCLPGTHSKWAQISDSKVENFHTSFTGELYSVLVQHSMLVRGEQDENFDVFMQGVSSGQHSSALSDLLFSTRSRMLNGLHKSSECSSYLSGLLIGSEIRSALSRYPEVEHIHVIGNEILVQRYIDALTIFGLSGESYRGEAMAAKGLWRLFNSR